VWHVVEHGVERGDVVEHGVERGFDRGDVASEL
jgi:hypothetical protein